MKSLKAAFRILNSNVNFSLKKNQVKTIQTGGAGKNSNRTAGMAKIYIHENQRSGPVHHVLSQIIHTPFISLCTRFQQIMK